MKPLFVFSQCRINGGESGPAPTRSGQGFGDMLSLIGTPTRSVEPRMPASTWSLGATDTEELASDLVAEFSALAERLGAGVEGDLQLSPAGMERFERHVAESVKDLLESFDARHGTRTLSALSAATTAAFPVAMRTIASTIPSPAEVVSATISSTLRALNIAPGPGSAGSGGPLPAAQPQRSPTGEAIQRASEPDPKPLGATVPPVGKALAASDIGGVAVASAGAARDSAAATPQLAASQGMMVRATSSGPAILANGQAAQWQDGRRIEWLSAMGEQPGTSTMRNGAPPGPFSTVTSTVPPSFVQRAAAATLGPDPEETDRAGTNRPTSETSQARAPLQQDGTVPATALLRFTQTGGPGRTEMRQVSAGTADGGSAEPERLSPIPAQPSLAAPHAAPPPGSPAAAGARPAHGTPVQPDPAGAGIFDHIRRGSVNEGRTRIELSPEGLGAIEVELGADDAGHLRILVRAESPAVLSILRGDRAGLLNALGESGVALDDAGLDFQSFGGQTGEERSQGAENQGPRSETTYETSELEVPVPSLAPTTGAKRGATGRLDIFT